MTPTSKQAKFPHFGPLTIRRMLLWQVVAALVLGCVAKLPLEIGTKVELLAFLSFWWLSVYYLGFGRAFACAVIISLVSAAASVHLLEFKGGLVFHHKYLSILAWTILFSFVFLVPTAAIAIAAWCINALAPVSHQNEGSSDSEVSLPSVSDEPANTA